MNKAEIKEFRKKYSKKHRKLSQKQLGILLGYSHDQIYRLESGKRKITEHFEISLKNLGAILDYGDVKIPN